MKCVAFLLKKNKQPYKNPSDFHSRNETSEKKTTKTTHSKHEKIHQLHRPMAIKLKNSKGESMEFGNLRGFVVFFFFEKWVFEHGAATNWSEKQAKLNTLVLGITTTPSEV